MCTAAGMGIGASPLSCGSCRYHAPEVLVALKMLFALQMSKNGNGLVKAGGKGSGRVD